MVQKKQLKKVRVRTVALFLLFPLVVWFIAFFVWFYWYDLSDLFGKNDRGPVQSPARSIDNNQRRERAPSSKPQEKILEDDRKKLEDILKRRS